MTGTLFCVVGPSGAGKDSVMEGARARLAGEARMVFPRRLVTRPADSGGEDHVPVTPDVFVALRDSGAFALSWEAHGIAYGIPTAIEDELRAGRNVVVNISRQAVPDARVRYGARIVEITAEPGTLAHRLAGRGRETEAEIRGRLARSVSVEADETIHNDGPLEESVEAFLAALKRLGR